MLSRLTRSTWLPLLAAWTVFVSCGGKVVVDRNGAGGDGGSGGSSTSSSSSASSSSGSGGQCVDRGDCSECFTCGNNGPCAAAFSACEADPACEAFQACTAGCQDIGPEECLDLCTAREPTGASEYVAWVQCSACTVCSDSCQVAFSFFCD